MFELSYTIKQNPLVSVILPVYNGEEFLINSIEGILVQTYTNFELIIINDCSTDQSDTVIKAIKDKRIVYINNEKNIRLISTLNLGLSIAKGKYIVRIDQDDIATPNRIEKQVEYMENNANCVVCGSYTQLIKNNKLTDEYIKFYTDNNDLKFSLLFFSPFVHPATIIRKNVLDCNGITYNTSYLHAEDYHLWTVLSNYGEFHTIPEVLTYYRIHDNQTSSIHQNFQLKQIDKIRFEFFSSMKSNFTASEMEMIINLSTYNYPDTNILFNVLIKFMKNDNFHGNAKEKYISSKIKELILESNYLTSLTYITFIASPCIWKGKYTYKQLFSVILKCIKYLYRKN